MTKLAIVGAKAVALLPWRLGLWIGRLLGRLAWHLLRSRRTVTLTNLTACFPELNASEVRELARQNFVETGMGLIESCAAYFGPDRFFNGRYAIEGLDTITAAQQTGRGILLLSGHASSIELAIRILNTELSTPAWQLVRRNNNQVLENAIDQGRRQTCEKTFDKKDIRGVLKALRKGAAVFYGPDQNFTYHFVFAPFFDVPAASVTATAELAGRGHADVIPVWCIRDADGQYRITVESPWTAFPSGDAIADATRVNQWLETKIRQAPAQYLWSHRRFRTQPDGAPPFYSDDALRRKHRL